MQTIISTLTVYQATKQNTSTFYKRKITKWFNNKKPVTLSLNVHISTKTISELLQLDVWLIWHLPLCLIIKSLSTLTVSAVWVEPCPISVEGTILPLILTSISIRKAHKLFSTISKILYLQLWSSLKATNLKLKIQSLIKNQTQQLKKDSMLQIYTPKSCTQHYATQ